MTSRHRRLVAVSHTGLHSGAETVLLRALDAVADAGWSVTCLSPDGPFADRLAAKGIGRVRIPELKLPAGSRARGTAVLGGRTVVVARALRRAARGADVVLANGLLALPAARVARLDAPLAWIVHDVVRRPDWLAVLRLAAPAVDLALPVSEATSQPLRTRGVPVRVVRNGTPWPVDAAPVDEPEGTPVIGCAALLTPWKGQSVLLDAVARLHRRDVVVELAGGRFPKDAPYVEQLEARAQRPDLRGRVRFLGQVADPLAVMRGWTVAVLPSVDPESGPLSLLEYMSVGVPVVATDHGGSPEVIGDAGLLVEPGSAAALAAALERLLGDRELRRSCAEAGRRQVAAGLTLDHQRRELVEVLSDLADGGGQAAPDAA